ncbi:hypothetical protein PSCICN_44150 [Pseudomonas cichorii]|uniref:hypothetical protein n=1 Tax=Pseudomonas cichorii TaxID=36746 RepID=UPI00191055CA|nr:hypothetical protein [Pseudomonas cichorii]GFM83723.1 hypothetical protein PSCICN_44150 [Pseudomonas cichorii]
MAGFFKIPRAVSCVRVLALLIGGLAFSNANAAVELDSSRASSSDNIVTSFTEFGRGTALRNSDFTVGNIQEIRAGTNSNTRELESLKKVVEEQAKAIEELKRNSKASASSSSSSDSEISTLKRKLDEQSRSIDKFEGQVNDLKRSSGSSSSSSSSELSSLKSKVDEQGRDVARLEGQVNDLKRSSGSSSSSSSSELSSLKRDLSSQQSELSNVKRSLDDLSRKVK